MYTSFLKVQVMCICRGIQDKGSDLRGLMDFLDTQDDSLRWIQETSPPKPMIAKEAEIVLPIILVVITIENHYCGHELILLCRWQMMTSG